MSELVQQLRSAAENAIDRGFAILTCLPHKKDPWPQYSPHAVNSATHDKSVALKPWNDGHEANYGISGGKSNLAFVDCDHGLQDEAALYAWMAKNNLPPTLIVRSGRDTEAGFHLYYTGAVPTCGFQLDGVTGEVKSIGGYVVGPGSMHPSGLPYKIVNDIQCTPLPEIFQNIAKEKHKAMTDWKPKDGLIPEGNRWAHLQSKAGKFKDMGLNEEGIYLALKNFCSSNCENGDNYPDEKIRNLAEWAASDECEGSDQSLVTVGSPDPEADSNLPEMPLSVLEGDYIGDLGAALTDGTFIPPSFARADAKTILGAILDGNIGFPGEEDIHMRHWTSIISTRPETGKSVCWTYCRAALNPLLTKHAVHFPPSGFFSSGEHAIKTLAEYDNASHLAYFDEMRLLFDKGGASGSTLFSKLLPLYESKSAAIGSITNPTSSFGNVSLSLAGNFTRSGFDRSVSGKGAGGDGFLSRMVLDFSNGINYHGDWTPTDTVKANTAVQKMETAIQWLLNWKGEHEGKVFVPAELADAKALRIQFQHWLKAEKDKAEKQHPGSGYCSRLEAHFKRDVLIRVACTPFTDQPVITKEMIQRSWDWTRHQLMLREEMWPVDTGGAVEKFEKRIVNALTKYGPLTKSGLTKFSNAANCDGGFEAWNRAWTSLKMAGKVVLMPVKSDRGHEKWGFDDAIWSKAKQKWIFGNPNA